MSAVQLLKAVNDLPRRELGAFLDAFLDALVQRERKALLLRLEDADDVKQAHKVLASTKKKSWVSHEKVKARLGWK